MKILIPILILFFIVSCAAPDVVCPDGTVVKDSIECPLPPMPPEPVQEVVQAAEELAMEEDATLDPKVQALFDKSLKVKSMSFTFSATEKIGSEYVQVMKRTYTILDDKVRVDISTLGNYQGDIEADTVYLDLTSETAKGFCTEGNNCRTPEPRTAEFDDYVIPSPLSWIDHVTANAKLAGDKNFDESTPMTIVRYEKEGVYYEMLVQPFYGVPVSITAYEDEALGSPLWKFEYRDAAYNLVKTADVTSPQ